MSPIKKNKHDIRTKVIPNCFYMQAEAYDISMYSARASRNKTSTCETRIPSREA